MVPLQVTIITATYNSAKTVEDTLKSVAQQDYTDIEHIIIDGASSDHTLKIVAQYPSVSVVVSEPDKGIYDAMNKGIKRASGDIIGILNSDDFYENSHVITHVVHAFENNPDVNVLYADLVFVEENNPSVITRIWKAGRYHRNNFLKGWMPPHPTFFVRKQVYEKFGVFNTSLKSAADYELMLRFLYKQGIKPYYLPQTIIKMRNGGQSTASLKNRWFANREDREAWRMNGLKPHFYTLYLKPLRKINQFFVRFL